MYILPDEVLKPKRTLSPMIKPDLKSRSRNAEIKAGRLLASLDTAMILREKLNETLCRGQSKNFEKIRRT